MFKAILFYKLFGWEYVAFRFAGDDFICRVLDINGVKRIHAFDKFYVLAELPEWQYFYVTPRKEHSAIKEE